LHSINNSSLKYFESCQSGSLSLNSLL
jgi:hypothetical protein